MRPLLIRLLPAAILASVLTCPLHAARKSASAPNRDSELTSAPGHENPVGSITGGVNFSESLSSGWADVLMPLASSEGLHLFGNIRGMWDDASQSLYSVGGVVRYLVPNRKIIVGVNAYYDALDSREKRHFDQFGFGAELLTRWFDARFNYFAPDHNLKRTDILPGIFRYESGLEGWDIEAGFLVPWLERYAETRILGGCYDYRSVAAIGAKSQGWKARAEIRWTPGVITDIEYWDDRKVNRGNWVAGIRISLPFDISRIAKGQNPFAGAGDAFKFGRHREFKERLGETVIRTRRVQIATSGLYGDLEYFGAKTLDSSQTLKLGSGVAPIEAIIRDASGSVVGAIFGLTRAPSGALIFGNVAGQNQTSQIPSVSLSAVNAPLAGGSWAIAGGSSRSAVLMNISGATTLNLSGVVSPSGAIVVFTGLPVTGAAGSLAAGNYTGLPLRGSATGIVSGSDRMLFIDSNAFIPSFAAPYIIRGEPVPSFSF